MALCPGDKFGPLAILAPIGKGGMCEVYRARDTKLKRDGAIKVLPEEFARHGFTRVKLARSLSKVRETHRLRA